MEFQPHSEKTDSSLTQKWYQDIENIFCADISAQQASCMKTKDR